jgi:hypothetical protein
MTWTRIYALDGPFQGNLVAMFLMERDAVEWANAHCSYAHVMRKLIVDTPFNVEVADDAGRTG